mgnify:CR=1 FL=1
MYNPNEMDNTLNEGLNNPENRNQEADAASTEQAPFESASEEPTSEAVQDASESVQETDHYESQASNEAHAEQTQASSYTSAYTNPTNSYSHYQANPYGQQPYNAYQHGQGNPSYTPYGYSDGGAQHDYSERQSQVMWQGDYYHSYQNPYAQAAQKPQKPKKEKKPMSKGKKTALKVVAGVMACLMVSVGSIGGFVALINNGYISVNNSGNSTEPAFTINKLVDNNQPASTVSGELTPQEVAKKVIPSVVCIQNYQRSNNNSMFFFGGGAQSGDAGDEVSPVSEGSGIIATSDGYIITNAHVVEGASSLKVILSDGTSYEAQLVGSDSITDLAVIKIDATGLQAAEFGSSGDLEVGDSVMAIGNPGGLELSSSVTQGIVSALNRQITNSETGYTMDCIQTDTAINPGNSGGALVNMYGQVVGINSSKIVAEGYEGLGFAIPIDDAQSVISNLKEYGYVKDRAVLGITGQYLDSMSARFYGLTSGMYVASISNESVSNAGITQGCIITKIDDTNITSSSTITSYVSKLKPGDKVTLTVVNDLTGRTFTADVTLVQASGQ